MALRAAADDFTMTRLLGVRANIVIASAFASVQEGVGPSSHITYSFWFMVPSGNDGLTVSSSLTDAPGARLTYAAIRDVGGSAHVQVVGILQGSGFINTRRGTPSA